MLSNNQPRPNNNAMELVMPPAFDEKLVTSDEDRKQLRLVAIALAERFVNHLFACDPETKPSSNSNSTEEIIPLSEFIYRVIRRTNASLTTLFVALIYLIRLKQKHPACKGTHSSPHRLLLAAIIISYKYLYDNCYHNRSWAQVSHDLFKLEEINKMEVELLFFLGFQLYVSKLHWAEFVQFMDGKLTRSLTQAPNQSHLRKCLWVELFPLDGIERLFLYTNPGEKLPNPTTEPISHPVKTLPSTKRSTISISTPSLSATQSDSSMSSKHSLVPTPDSHSPKSHHRHLFQKVFTKPDNNPLSHAWLDLSILPRRRRNDPTPPAHTNLPDPLSKSVLSNVTLRSHHHHHRRSQKFSLPPIWNLMSHNNTPDQQQHLPPPSH